MIPSGAPFRRLLRRLEAGYHELVDVDAELDFVPDWAAYRAAGFIRPAERATTARCPDCATDSYAVAYLCRDVPAIRCPACGPVRLTPAALARSRLDVPALLRAIGDAAGTAGSPTEIASGVWRMGPIRAGLRSKEAFVAITVDPATVLVTSYGYNAAGWTESVTDPMGLVGKTFYDLAGRTPKMVENYVDGTVSDADDKTVEFTFNGNGDQATLAADLAGGGQQTTANVYGVGTGSDLVSNDLVAAVEYSDPSTGSPSSSLEDTFTFNRLGQVKTKTDRNGTVHTYTYDVLGRVVSDAITTLGSGVDGAVRRIETAYDGQSNAYLITSYDAASGGNVVNQVQRSFNGLGQLVQEWQATIGAVNTGTTPSVQYAYSFAPSGSTNHSRLTSITYPNGRVITYNYATGLADNISRLSSIADGSTTLETYDYLGLCTVVKRGHPQTGIDLIYEKLTGESNADAGDQYTGLDRFGRVADQRWTTSSGTAADRRQYGYDRDSNRLYADNKVSTSNSELYAYDGLNQLTNFQRGTLNGTKDGLTGSPSRSQSWDFDAAGNFDSQTTDGTTQTRSANKQNEITSVSGATTPTYDAAGNMTRDETGRMLKYDAWNRLVEVRDSGNGLLATYRYDALGRRVRETRGSTTTELSYSSDWQVLEERVGSTPSASYVWSPVYVDALVARDRDTNGDGTLDERLYAIQDANWNVVALVNTSGMVVERYLYDGYGAFMVLDGSWGSRSNSSFTWIYLHQGGRWDASAGVYSFRNREYAPALARWLQSDPIRSRSGDANWYRYEHNNPLCRLDNLGLTDKPGTGGISGPGVKIQGPGNYTIPEPSLVFVHGGSVWGDLFWVGTAVAHPSRTFPNTRSWDDVLNGLKGRKVDKDHLYQSLVLSGHGCGGGCSAEGGADAISGSTLKELAQKDPKKFQQIKKEIDRLLAPGAPIIIAACCQANDGGTSELAKLLGRPVIANAGNVKYFNCGKGGWYRFDP